MSTIKVVKTVEIHLDDIIEAIIDTPITSRWNYIAALIDSIDLEERERLTTEETKIIKAFLTRKLNFFSQQ